MKRSRLGCRGFFFNLKITAFESADHEIEVTDTVSFYSFSYTQWGFRKGRRFGCCGLAHEPILKRWAGGNYEHAMQ